MYTQILLIVSQSLKTNQIFHILLRYPESRWHRFKTDWSVNVWYAKRKSLRYRSKLTKTKGIISDKWFPQGQSPIWVTIVFHYWIKCRNVYHSLSVVLKILCEIALWSAKSAYIVLKYLTRHFCKYYANAHVQQEKCLHNRMFREIFLRCSYILLMNVSTIGVTRSTEIWNLENRQKQIQDYVHTEMRQRTLQK